MSAKRLVLVSATWGLLLFVALVLASSGAARAWAAGESAPDAVTCTLQDSAPVTTTTPTATTTPCPMNFSDVHPSDYFYQGVNFLYCAGAISGYADGTFRPYNYVTLGQIIKMEVLTFHITIYVPPGPSFCGVPSTDPFYRYITSMFYYLYGGEPLGGCPLNPYRYTTRAQIVKQMVILTCWPINTAGGPHFSDVPLDDPFYQYIETAYNRGVISGYADGTFRRYNNVTRGQASKIIYNSVQQGLFCPPGSPTPVPVPTVKP